MKRILFILMMLITVAAPAGAEVNVVATLPWIGSLAREIGGSGVSGDSAREAPPGSALRGGKTEHDPGRPQGRHHHVQRPRSGDRLSAPRSGIVPELGSMPGKPGNFDCSRFVTVIERPLRRIGGWETCIHSAIPITIFRRKTSSASRKGWPTAGRSGQGQRRYVSGESARIRARYNEGKRNRWQPSLMGKKYIAYHKLFGYLEEEYGFRIVGYMEPKPGIPPSAAHIEVADWNHEEGQTRTAS